MRDYLVCSPLDSDGEKRWMPWWSTSDSRRLRVWLDGDYKDVRVYLLPKDSSDPVKLEVMPVAPVQLKAPRFENDRRVQWWNVTELLDGESVIETVYCPTFEYQLVSQEKYDACGDRPVDL